MRDALPALAAPILVPLRALAFALAGALAATRLLEGDLSLLVLVAACLVSGIVLFEIGRAQLPKRPRIGLFLMEGWILAPLSLALPAATIAVVIGVLLVHPEGASNQEKTVTAAASTAIATLLAAAVVAWSEDQNGSRSSSRIRAAFHQK